MIELVEQRLALLREERETGAKELVELKSRVKELQITLHRISGAIQVLEELQLRHGSQPLDTNPLPETPGQEL